MSWSAPNKRKHCAMAWGRRQRRGCSTTQTSHGRSREGNGDGQLCFARWPLEEMMLRLKPFQQGLPGQATRHSGQMGSCRKFGSLEELQLTWNLRRAMTRSFRTRAWGGGQAAAQSQIRCGAKSSARCLAALRIRQRHRLSLPAVAQS